MKESLIVKHLGKSFNQVSIFSNISFNLSPGSVVSLEGINGSGKTTLMKIIGSQILDYSGEVLLGNKNIKDYGSDLFSNIYYLSPFPNLYEYLTLNENISFFSNLNDIQHIQSTNSLISSFNLDKYALNKVHELSDGTKKKISILISFLVSPDFFLLDEPYTYLDSHSIKILNNLIEQSSKKGKSFLIADNSSGILNFTGSVGL